MRYAFGPQPHATPLTFTACTCCGLLHDHRQPCRCRRLQADPRPAGRITQAALLLLSSILLASLAWWGVLVWLRRM